LTGTITEMSGRFATALTGFCREEEETTFT
jgi:hypothetical protein